MSLPAMFFRAERGAFKARFQLQQVGISQETVCYLMGVVRVRYVLRIAEITSGSSFEPNNPTEQKLGYA